MYQIEKAVPMPPRKGARKYPFDSMEVGDSFVVPSKKKKSAACSAHAAGKVLGRKFSMRQDGSVHRIWRIA